jgi:hypothetical protein
VPIHIFSLASSLKNAVSSFAACVHADTVTIGKSVTPCACGRQIRVDFFLFPHLKSIMKGARVADVAAIQERVTAVLRSITKEVFADSFQKLYERCQQCVVKDGFYFEGQ